MTFMHRMEAIAARSAIRLLRTLGPVRSSNVCGAIARRIGPLLPVSKVADRNLRLALPELDEAARKRIVRGVWENLGRIAGEFPHLSQLTECASGPGWEVAGAEHLEALVARGGPAIMFAGHIGNWEVVPLATARTSLHCATVYRAFDNREIDAMILEMRRAAAGVDVKFFPKGAQGARQTLAHLRQQGVLGLLQDQKMNDGIHAEFFGHPAMTASSLAALALKTGCPVLPTYVRRLAPARFRVTYEAPMPLPATGDRAADIAALTQTVNDRLERWIRAEPESWLWLHRRWPKEIYAEGG